MREVGKKIFGLLVVFGLVSVVFGVIPVDSVSDCVVAESSRGPRAGVYQLNMWIWDLMPGTAGQPAGVTQQTVVADYVVDWSDGPWTNSEMNCTAFDVTEGETDLVMMNDALTGGCMDGSAFEYDCLAGDYGSAWADWLAGDDVVLVAVNNSVDADGSCGNYTAISTWILDGASPDDVEYTEWVKIPTPQMYAVGVDWVNVSIPRFDNPELTADGYGGTNPNRNNTVGFAVYASTVNNSWTADRSYLKVGEATFSDASNYYFNYTGLSAGDYYFASAVITRGCYVTYLKSDGSAPVTITDTTPPAAPTGLTATSGDTVVNLSWNANTESDLAGYNVYRSETSGSGYVKINTALVIDTFYHDTTVTNGVTYYYVIKAVDTTGNPSPYSNEVYATPNAASTTGTISGTVKDSVTEEGIPEAIVTAYNTGTTTVASSTTTVSNGTYSMELEAGTYDVEASAAGYETSDKRTENVTAGADTPNVNFALTAEDVDVTGPTITNLLPAANSTVAVDTPTISANYTDPPSGIDTSSVVLKVDEVDVTSNATVTVNGVSYTPAAALSDGVHTVYVEVKDASNNSNAANTTWSFTVDTESPVIAHTAVTSATEGEKITITAAITDNIGLTAISVFYRVTGTGSYTGKAMTYVSGNDYTVDIPASAVTTAGVEYYIWAKDGVNNATDGTAALPHSVDVSAANHAPTLSSGGVSPGSGKTDTTFTFSVTYTDADNNAPTIKNVYIDDVAYGMSSTDTDYTDGVVFTYSTTLSKESHTYYFEFSDGTASVRLPTSGTSSGPSVTEKASKPAFIPGIGMIGTTLALFGAALIIWKKRKVGE